MKKSILTLAIMAAMGSSAAFAQVKGGTSDPDGVRWGVSARLIHEH